MGNLISEETLHKLEADTSFQQLSQKMQTLNIFEVLGITNAEIRHSNFLAWLLDPNGNHGMGDKFLREFVSKLGQREVVPENVTVCIVRREWQHIDLLVLCQKEKYLLCVENKVFSEEHDNQLRRYRDMLLEEYPDYTMSFAFLSPDGIAPLSADDQQYWQTVSYADILDAIESAKGGSALLPEVNMLLDHYTAAVRRHIVGDDNIKKLCQDFYDRHKEVLDTIYENCKTSLNPICEVAEDWCREKSEQGELIFSPQWSNNTYTRFTTEAIRKLFPQHTKPISGWKTTDMAFYEIIKLENYFKITLSLCSDNLTDEQRAACDRVSQALNRPDRKEDWRWKRIRNWPRHTIESEPNSENYKEEIYRYLNANWREIQKFENDLLNKTE